MNKIFAARWTVRGRVQGVGARPAVARLAEELHLVGSVRNTLSGLTIEVEGTSEQLVTFRQRLPGVLPTTDRLPQMEEQSIAPFGHRAFTILQDPRNGSLVVQVPPDTGVCEECLAEECDGRNRRHRYGLTTCAQCGPRYTLVESMPFEREGTSLRRFSMCAACRNEYKSSADRRFHAQTITCALCGPRIWLVDSNGCEREAAKAVAGASAALVAGRILALRGVGGYQLLCDATNESAVLRLRSRKGRPAKPFAVLTDSLDQALLYGILSPAERKALCDPANPIVLVSATAPSSLSEHSLAQSVHPGLNTVGLMLPSTPLHAWLSRIVQRPLACTSGNRDGEPLEFEVDAAERVLAGVADLWLHHDRPIIRPIDDSVVRVIGGERATIRLARGIAPLPLEIPMGTPQLALGGHMKCAMAWSNGSQAVLGQHVGDLHTLAARERFLNHLADMQSLYRFQPERFIHDLHPDYFTTRQAAELGPVTLAVQHHFAHVAAGMVEHGLLDRRVLGVAWDGTGWGEEETIWGGEFLVTDRLRGFQRVAHLRPFGLIGGEVAIREPWRVAVSLLDQANVNADATQLWERPIGAVLKLLRYSKQVTPTTSAGRLFDGAAAIILGRDTAQFEGEAAMLLEAVADREVPGAYPLPLSQDSPRQLDWRPTIAALWHERQHGMSPAAMSVRFHRALANGIVHVAEAFAELPVILGGGVFQNRLLTELVLERMDHAGRLKLPGIIPVNDGGLAAGQLAVAAMRGWDT